MAFSSGTATDYKDLLARLRTFLTTLAADPWVEMRYTTGTVDGSGGTPRDELILKGVGTGGLDEIYVGIQTFGHLSADYHNWRLDGFISYDAGLTFGNMPGNMGRPSTVLALWNGSIPYWFVANGRRFIVVAKVSTVYVSMYAGFITPYASPQQYPYPLAIGGSMAFNAEPAVGSGSWRWSYAGLEHSNYPMGICATSVSGYTPQHCPMRVRKADGQWWGYNRGGSSTISNFQTSPNNVGGIWPYNSGMSNLGKNLGSTVQFPLLPIILHGNNADTVGELDGVYATTGQGCAAEDTFTVGADTYLVVPDIFRSTFRDFMAVRLA